MEWVNRNPSVGMGKSLLAIGVPPCWLRRGMAGCLLVGGQQGGRSHPSWWPSACPVAKAPASRARRDGVGEVLGDRPELPAQVGVEDRGGPGSRLAVAVEVLAGQALHLW